MLDRSMEVFTLYKIVVIREYMNESEYEEEGKKIDTTFIKKTSKKLESIC